MNIKINGVDVEVDNNAVSTALEKGEAIEVNNDSLVAKTDDTIVYKKPDFDQFIVNKTKERYEAGKEKGEKDAVNTISDKYGVTLDEEKKTVQNFAEKLSTKLAEDYKKEPNKKIDELEGEKQTLQGKLQEWQEKYNQFSGEVEQERTQRKVNSLISNNIPDNEYIIPKDKLQTLFKSEHDVTFDENDKPIVKKDGQVMKDENTLNPLHPKDVLEQFSKDYVKPASGGTGNGDEGDTGKPGSYEAFQKEMEKKGTQPGSEEFNREMQRRIEERTLNV